MDYQPRQKVWAWNGREWQAGRVIRCEGDSCRIAVYLPMPSLGTMVTSYEAGDILPRYDGQEQPTVKV
jgi:hypothetical protein